MFKIKECARSTCHTITFKIYTSIMKSSLIYGVLDLLNMFPYKDGVSDTLSPIKNSGRKKKVDMGQKRIAFGSYVMAHIGTTNTIKSIFVP